MLDILVSDQKISSIATCFLWVGLCILFISSCTNKFRQLPYDMIDPSATNHIYVPIELSIKALQDAVNDQLGDTLLSIENEKLWGISNLSGRLSKIHDIQLRTENDSIKSVVPIEVEIFKPTIIGDVALRGQLELELASYLDLGEDWEVITRTKVDSYKWLKKPKFQFGIINISVKTLADWMLRKGLESVAPAIDQQVNRGIPLRSSMKELAEHLSQPQLVSEEYNLWYSLDAKDFMIEELNLEAAQITTGITIKGHSQAFYSEQVPQINIPSKVNFSKDEQKPDGQRVFHYDIKMPLESLEIMLQKQMVGQVFQSGRQKVEVKSFHLEPSPPKLSSKVQVKGAFQGEIIVSGKPVFSKTDQRIKMKDLSINLKSKGFRSGLIAFLAKKRIKKMISEHIAFPMEERLSYFETTLETQIQQKTFNGGLQLDGDFSDLTIQQLDVYPAFLHLSFSAKGVIRLSSNQAIE